MNPIDSQQLCEDFNKYIRNIPSATLVATEYRTTFESWFRVELVQTMLQSGHFKKEDLIYNFNYPNDISKKSDVCFGGEIVFELKCFRSGADANKKREFPRQIDLLESHINSGTIKQGVCFITLQGYSKQQVTNMLQRFFGNRNYWNISQPHNFMSQPQFVFVIADYQKFA